MDASLLELICCPETHQPLRLAGPEFLADLNRRVAQGGVKTRSGQPVTVSVEEALVREDGTVAYRVAQGIPVLLPEEGILL